MGTLVIDHAGTRLEALPGRLRLSLPSGERREVPVGLLERVVIQARTEMESTVLGLLAESGVAVLLLSPRRHRRMAIVLGRPHNDLAVRVAQIERAGDPRWCLEWSRGLVRRKLRAQLLLAARIAAKRPQDRHVTEKVRARLGDALANAARAASIDGLRGIEGAAARAVFHLLEAAMPDELEFHGRNRRPPRDPVNALLSLTYTLVHFEAVRAAWIAGLDPFVGYYHRPSFSRESMACDLIEPLRPRVEEWVWRLFAERRLGNGDFHRERSGACLLSKQARGDYYCAYEEHAGPLRRALRRECRLIANVLRGRLQMEILEDGDDSETALS